MVTNLTILSSEIVVTSPLSAAIIHGILRGEGWSGALVSQGEGPHNHGPYFEPTTAQVRSRRSVRDLPHRKNNTYRLTVVINII